ncbi:hypothetical protein A0H81_02589 [Grifola frondosa]|uniref:RING-type domain-containing protein n=1 Tax=Grifola frondosa TaxID=5627 RepID=A0A1C7MM19_GRIFR|nr:hypothetical protein A0H81_02589 [Grifola frondosa]
MTTAHPTFACMPCKKVFYVEDRQRHYFHSPNHPNCFLCNVGYETDEALVIHVSAMHPQLRCAPCNILFSSVELVQEHYKISPMHPHCAICEVGFVDDAACDNHMSTNHPPLKQKALSSVCDARPTVKANSVAGSSSAGSPYASPHRLQRDLSTVDVPDVTVLALRDDVSCDSIEASSHVQRAVSEPTLPTVSSVGPSTHVGGPLSRCSTPASITSQKTLEYVSIPATTRSASSLSMQSVSSVSSSDDGDGADGFLPASPQLATLPQAEAVPLRAVCPQPQVPVTGSQTFATFPKPQPSTAPSSRSSSRQSFARSQQIVKVIVAGLRILGNEYESTIQGTHSPPARIASSNAPAGKEKGVSWNCRVCLKDPCAAPVVTICGHLFCFPCIISALAEDGYCPVCKKVMLVRLHVEN